MNYPPNIKHWELGDVVIHDADAKETRMLMKVVGYTRDGLAITRYCDRERNQKTYINEVKYLHDPDRFALKGSTP